MTTMQKFDIAKESMVNSQSDEKTYENTGIWASILRDVKSSTKKGPATKSLVVLGDDESGRTTLVAKLQEKDDPKRGSGLEYHYIDVKDDERDDTPKLGVWILDGDLTCAVPLVKFAIKPENIENLTVVLVASMSQPWSLLSTLNKWIKLIEDHLNHLKLDPVRLRQMREQLQYEFQHYDEPNESLKMHVSSSSSTPHSSATIRNSTDAKSTEIFEIPDGVLNKSLGIPIVVVITKCDAISTLAKDQEYTDEHFDFIQHHLRKFCLEYGAALFYTSVKEKKNIDKLYKYLIHRLYGYPFQSSASIIERDSIFIPSGWDSPQKTDILLENLHRLKSTDEYSHVFVKPTSRKSLVKDNETIIAEDDQEFLSKLQTTLNRATSPGKVDENKVPATSSVSLSSTGHRSRVQTSGSSSGAGTGTNEGALAKFFQGLLTKKSDVAVTPTSTTTSTFSRQVASQSPTTPSSKRLQQHPLTFDVTPPPGRMRTPTSQKPFPGLSSKNPSPSSSSREAEPAMKISLENLHSSTGTHQTIVSEVLPETPDGPTRKLDGLKTDDSLNSMNHTALSDQKQVFSENPSADTLEQSVDLKQVETVPMSSVDIRATDNSLALQKLPELDEPVIMQETDPHNKDQMDDEPILLTATQQEDESNSTVSNKLYTGEILNDYSEAKMTDEIHPIADATCDESLSTTTNPNEYETITTETNILKNIEKQDEDGMVTDQSTSSKEEHLSNIILVDPVVTDDNSTLLKQEGETVSSSAADPEQAKTADENESDATNEQLLIQLTASNSINCTNSNMDSVINQSTQDSLHTDRDISEQNFSQETELPSIDGSVMKVAEHQTSSTLPERQEFEPCETSDTDKKCQHNSTIVETYECDVSPVSADTRNPGDKPSSIFENTTTDLRPDQSSLTTIKSEPIDSPCSSEQNEENVEHGPLTKSISTPQDSECISSTEISVIERSQSVTQENNDLDPCNGLATGLVAENELKNLSSIPNNTDTDGYSQDLADHKNIDSNPVRPRTISISSTKAEQKSDDVLTKSGIESGSNEISLITLNKKDSPAIATLPMTRENLNGDDIRSPSSSPSLNSPINGDRIPIPVLTNPSESVADVLESSTEVDSANNKFKQMSLQKESESPFMDKDSVGEEISSVHPHTHQDDNLSSSIEDSTMLSETPKTSMIDSKDATPNFNVVSSEDKIELDQKQSQSSSSLDQYQTNYESIHENSSKKELNEDNLTLDSKSKPQSIGQLLSPGESEESTNLEHPFVPVDHTNTDLTRQSSTSSLGEMIPSSNTDFLLQNSETIQANSPLSSGSNDNYQHKSQYSAMVEYPIQQLVSASDIEFSQIEESKQFTNDNNSIERSKSLSALQSLNGEDSLQSPVISTSTDQQFDSSITSVSTVDQTRSKFEAISTTTANMTGFTSPMSTAIEVDSNEKHDHSEMVSSADDHKISLSPTVADKMGVFNQKTNVPRLSLNLSTDHDHSNTDLESIQIIEDCTESNSDPIASNNSIERSHLVTHEESEPVILFPSADSYGNPMTDAANRDQPASTTNLKDKTNGHEYENTSGYQDEDLPINYSESSNHESVDNTHNPKDDFRDSKPKTSEVPTSTNTGNTEQSTSVHTIDTVSSVMLSSTKSIELLPDTISASDTNHQSNMLRSSSQTALSRPTTLPFTSNNPDLDGLAIAYQNNNDDEDALDEQQNHENSSSITVNDEQRRTSLSDAANDDKQELSSNVKEIFEQTPVKKDSSIEGNR